MANIDITDFEKIIGEDEELNQIQENVENSIKPVLDTYKDVVCRLEQLEAETDRPNVSDGTTTVESPIDINFTGDATVNGVDNGIATVNITGGSTGTDCRVEGGTVVVDTDWNTSPISNNNGSINFNQANTGFTWIIGKGDVEIIVICDGIESNPIMSGGAIAGDMSITSLTLNGAVITPDSSTYNQSTQQLTVVSNSAIVNNSINSNTTFAIAGVFTIGTETGLTASTSLTYVAPAFSNSVVRNPNSALSFNNTYTGGTVAHNFPNGNATSVVSSVFGGTATGLGIGGGNITFTALNHNTGTTARTLAETVLFTNATMTSQTRNISSSALLSPTFFYEVYTGSVAAGTQTNLNTAALNSSVFTRIGTFTSRPASQNFSWVDPSDATLTSKILAIRRSFTNGQDIQVKTASQPNSLGVIVSPFMQVNVGDVSSALENYDLYLAQEAQPGAITLFIDFN